MKEYYILLNGKKIYVSKEVYLAYCSEENHEKYLERVDRKHQLLYFSDFDKENDSYIDHIKDESVDIEKVIETKMIMDELYRALDNLNSEERALIEALYFEEKSMRKFANEKKVNVMKISRKHKEILEKLKNILKTKI